ncbi:hypothetical protein KIN20_017722 [Parelaphostrongylus tenuis]|uniref:Uncharacterized protein n=1 Tax=Parelaphostrongylus tenuis TaxID=148309 RepID=A0AAD5MLX6_PARTN|nr:hypothetical protein KIN20_017722 [Parelaphostrongylus tenuis]
MTSGSDSLSTDDMKSAQKAMCGKRAPSSVHTDIARHGHDMSQHESQGQIVEANTTIDQLEAILRKVHADLEK